MLTDFCANQHDDFLKRAILLLLNKSLFLLLKCKRVSENKTIIRSHS